MGIWILARQAAVEACFETSRPACTRYVSSLFTTFDMTTLLQHWPLIRIMRACVAVWVAVEAYRTGIWWLLLPAALLGLQAFLQIGCCGSACNLPSQRPYDQ